ncbi:8612_t:CDS:1, partial [Dentiscutata erythropus]
ADPSIKRRFSLKRNPQPQERRDVLKKRTKNLAWDILPPLGTYYDDYEDQVSRLCGISAAMGDSCGYFESLAFFGAYHNTEDDTDTFGYYCPTVCDPSFGIIVKFNESAVVECESTYVAIYEAS